MVSDLQQGIRFLGRLLGDVIRAEDGQAVFDQIEDIRRASVAFHREGTRAAAEAFIAPVITAHPSEVRRKSVLDRQLAIGAGLAAWQAAGTETERGGIEQS